MKPEWIGEIFVTLPRGQIGRLRAKAAKRDKKGRRGHRSAETTRPVTDPAEFAETEALAQAAALFDFSEFFLDFVPIFGNIGRLTIAPTAARRMQYFVVMIDYGRQGREAIVDPEITRREVVARVASGEYRNISFIHEIVDLSVEDVTDGYSVRGRLARGRAGGSRPPSRTRRSCSRSSQACFPHESETLDDNDDRRRIDEFHHQIEVTRA